MYSQKEKQALITLIGSWVILGIYSLYIYYNYIVEQPEIINDLQFWGTAFLILIPVSIIAQIIIHIIFAIVNKVITKEDMEMLEDEMDKLIELKAARISHWSFVLGFALTMGAIAFGSELYVMFLMLIGSGFLSGTFEALAKIYFYRRGV